MPPGDIWTTQPLDREQISSYTLIIEAADAGGRRSFAQLDVVVSDVNDNPPVVDRGVVEAVVWSNATRGSHIATVGMQCFLLLLI